MPIGRPPVHGHARNGGTPTYQCWFSMKHRCYNKYNASYEYYGAKGVVVCERWHSFVNFLADMGECPERGYHISRHGDRGNYEPGNCTWKKGFDNLSERFYEKGEKVYNAKLTEEKVRHIRKLSSEGASDSCLASRFKVDRKTIWSVVRRKTWTHVE